MQLEKVLKRVDEFENHSSELTKDALLAELRSFYDLAKNHPVNKVSETVEEQPVPVAEVSPEPVAPTPEPVAETTIEEPVAEEPTPEPELIEEKEVQSAQAPVVAEEKKPLIGKEEEAKPLDEKILAGQLSRKPLEDLTTGIPLNEKFGIIRGLFQGNATDYGDAVLKLNNAASSTEMQHYMSLLEQRYGWDTESKPYQAFLVFVSRKMLTLETSDTNSNQ